MKNAFHLTLILLCTFLGLNHEGLYRVSGIKSKIDELKYFYDHGMLDLV